MTMGVAENTRAVASDVIPESHSVANNLPEQKSEQRKRNEYVSQNIEGNVVYIQCNPQSDTRVTNALQGRQVETVNDIPGMEIYNQNKAPERVMNVVQKAIEVTDNCPSGTVSPMCTNTVSAGIVYIQPNTAEGNVSSNIIPGAATLEPNATHNNNINVCQNTISNDSNQVVRVINVPYAPGSNMNQSGLPGIILHDPNSIQGQVHYATNNVAHHMPWPNNSQSNFQYVSQNMPNRTLSPNNSQGHFQYLAPNMPNRTQSPNNSQGHFPNAPHNMPNGMPSPNHIQSRSLEVLNQAMNIAGKLVLHQNENKEPENVYTAQPMATPILYSPCIMGDGSGFIPQMQYQTPYMSQSFLTPVYNMQQVNQLSYVPPVSQPVQDSLYMSSPTIDAEQVSFAPDFLLSQPPHFDISNVGTQIMDNMNIDAGNEECCSWYDYCCCLFSCCGNE